MASYFGQNTYVMVYVLVIYLKLRLQQHSFRHPCSQHTFQFDVNKISNSRKLNRLLDLKQ